MNFRDDINALRALAVTSVVLYHYKVNFIPGGFVGVDVFFVISGYLMTTIITKRLAGGSFGLWHFYNERARRIIPGLVGLCFGLLAAGYFVLEPGAYQTLGSEAIGALLFVSNFQFWEGTSYFDPQSVNKWLLHSWSLSVEWQFYLLYPIILLCLHAARTTRYYLAPILWLLTLASFVLCVWSASYYPASAFYLLPQRAWEMLAGGIVALQFRYSQWKYPSILIGFGVLAIFVAIFGYDNTMAWPSYWALLPVIGTCLVIAANQAGASLFNNQIVQTLGKWSYSIYLWHWPIAVAAVYFYFVKTTALKIACEILILTAILAIGTIFLSLIERMWTRLLPERGMRTAAGVAIAMVLILAFAFTVTNEGLIGRRQDIAMELESYAKAAHDWTYPDECIGTDSAGNLKPCRLGREKDRGVLFIGDSFAMHIYERFAKAAKLDPETSFTFLASLGCPPVTGMRIVVQDRYNCNGFFYKALQFAKMHQFKRIVLASIWNTYFTPKEGWMCFETSGGCRLERDPSSYYRQLDAALSDLRSRLLELKVRGAEIVILWATPWGRWNVPSELAKRKFLGLDTKDIEYIDRVEFENNAEPIKGRLRDLASAIGGKFVDPFDFLCDDQRCPTVDQNGVPYFIDGHHIRASMVRTARYQFLDDAAGLSEQLPAASEAGSTSGRR